MSTIIDCKGLTCPKPVINTKKYFDSIEQGEATILVDNEVSKNNVVKFAQSNGFQYSVEEKESLYYIYVNKVSAIKCDAFNQNLTIVISTDKLGLGDDTLGATLMKSYLYALSESDTLPSNLIFLNGGVKLTVSTSASLDTIKVLAQKGVNILSCGACLDFFNLKDNLAVGEISNMYTIVEKMNLSTNTIKL